MEAVDLELIDTDVLLKELQNRFEASFLVGIPLSNKFQKELIMAGKGNIMKYHGVVKEIKKTFVMLKDELIGGEGEE